MKQRSNAKSNLRADGIGGVAEPHGHRHVVILIPMTWSVRNVVTSGLTERLTGAGIEVTLLVRKRTGWEHHAKEIPGVRTEEIILPPLRLRIRGRALLNGIISTSFEHRNGTRRSKAALRRIMRRDGVVASVRRVLIDMIGSLCRITPVYRSLVALAARLYRLEHDLSPVRDHLQRLKPTLLYSTFCVDVREYPYIIAATHLRIPTAAAILSFDNLTSRAEIPRFDHYFVWNERMRQDLITLAPGFRRSFIAITGTPQFDFHRRTDFRWTREETLARLGLPSGARYVLYAANARTWTPTEPDLVAELADRMYDRSDLRDLWVLVRLHPMDTCARWENLANIKSRIRLSSPWALPPDDEGWTYVMPDDQRLLANSVAYCEACVSMCSTMALDAAIHNRPAIGVAYASVPDSQEEHVYRQAYLSHHYRPLVRSGGLRLAHTPDEMLELIRRAMQFPDEDRLARQQMVDRECGVVDGQATGRIVEAIKAVVQLYQP